MGNFYQNNFKLGYPLSALGSISSQGVWSKGGQACSWAHWFFHHAGFLSVASSARQADVWERWTSCVFAALNWYSSHFYTQPELTRLALPFVCLIVSGSQFVWRDATKYMGLDVLNMLFKNVYGSRANEILSVIWPDISLCFTAKDGRHGTKSYPCWSKGGNWLQRNMCFNMHRTMFHVAFACTWASCILK